MRPGALAAAVCSLLSLVPAAARGQASPDALREAKTLFFDREYARSREAWRVVRDSGRGANSAAALYWIARCSEKLGESERALAEYQAYIDSGQLDPTLREEAATSRIALATRLYKHGNTRHLRVAENALRDGNKTVRYFAALQLGSLDPAVGKAAIPVLKEIIAEETDEDLVERAKIALFRLDREALAEASPPPPRHGRGPGWVHVRIWEKGHDKPQLSLNVPMALAELVFKSLPEDARDDLRKKGYDADTFWSRLKSGGPADILTVEGDDGGRIEVWIE